MPIKTTKYRARKSYYLENPRFVIFSDLHLHNTYYNMEDSITVMNAIKKELEPNDILVFLGDFFELKDRIPNEVISLGIELLKDIPNKKIFLLGNHDYKVRENPTIKYLSILDNFELITEPTLIDDIYAFVPYYPTKIEFEKVINDLPDNCILFTHNDIAGFELNNNIKLTTDIAVSYTTLQKKFKYVINGHLHKKQVRDNVFCIGACKQTSFKDVNVTPHYIILTQKYNLIKFYRIKGLHKFLKIEINNTKDIDQFIKYYIYGKKEKYIVNFIIPYSATLSEYIKKRMSNYPDIIKKFIISYQTEKINKKIVKENITLKTELQDLFYKILEEEKIDNKKQFLNFIMKYYKQV